MDFGIQIALFAVQSFLKEDRQTMISWKLLLGGKTLSDQAYAIVTRLVDQACDCLDNTDPAKQQDDNFSET